MMRRRTLLALLAAAVAVAVVVGTCKSDEERISDAIDDARDALDERRREDFMAFFADPLVYRSRRGRADLERDVENFCAPGYYRIDVLGRQIRVDGDSAAIELRCRVRAATEPLGEVTADLTAEKRDGEWIVTRLDWK
jgi:hypothetical protein